MLNKKSVRARRPQQKQRLQTPHRVAARLKGVVKNLGIKPKKKPRQDK